MKFRHKGSSGSDNVELEMTPMIDIVFQLLIFFLLTFKVVEQEADFNIQMPASGAPQQLVTDVELQTLRVRMEADGSGILTQLKLDGRPLAPPDGRGDRFDTLHARIRSHVGDGGGPTADAYEVEFKCDFNLKYDYVIRAITAVSGYRQGSGDNVETIKLIGKIKFAPSEKKSS